MRPRLLDLFCGAGGAAMGYHRAGFEVVGIDIKPQPHYPFEFHQADALTFLLEGYDAYHASPPCQAYTAMRWHNNHPDLYVITRDLLKATNKPYVIENVIGAPYQYGIVLCGSMFGLKIQRHRNFETSWMMFQLPCNHKGRERPLTITGKGSKKGGNYKHSRHAAVSEWPEIMQMPWAKGEEIAQAIPPAYTEYIGKYLIEEIENDNR